MDENHELPILGVSGKEAANILGIRELSVARLVSQGVIPKTAKHARFALDRSDVERVALERYQAGHRYWLSTREAAEVLGVGTTRVLQLVDRGFLPAVKHEGRWNFRRHQVEVIANARESRKLR